MCVYINYTQKQKRKFLSGSSSLCFNNASLQILCHWKARLPWPLNWLVESLSCTSAGTVALLSPVGGCLNWFFLTLWNKFYDGESQRRLFFLTFQIWIHHIWLSSEAPYIRASVSKHSNPTISLDNFSNSFFHLIWSSSSCLSLRAAAIAMSAALSASALSHAEEVDDLQDLWL